MSLHLCTLRVQVQSPRWSQHAPPPSTHKRRLGRRVLHWWILRLCVSCKHCHTSNVVKYHSKLKSLCIFDDSRMCRTAFPSKRRVTCARSETARMYARRTHGGTGGIVHPPCDNDGLGAGVQQSGHQRFRFPFTAQLIHFLRVRSVDRGYTGSGGLHICAIQAPFLLPSEVLECRTTTDGLNNHHGQSPC